MKKAIILLTVNLFTAIVCQAQRVCGTVSYQGNDTAILNRIAEQEQKIQEWINASTESRSKYFKVQYPTIPGFTPTGDNFKDATDYANAKKRFYETDPVGYKKWSDALTANNPLPTLTPEEQKRVEEKIKKRKI